MSSMKSDSTSNARSGYDSWRHAASVPAPTRGYSTGRYSPPSGARPSSRISQKLRSVLSPRVLMYFTAEPSIELFFADANDRRKHRRQRLHLRDRLVHLAFD